LSDSRIHRALIQTFRVSSWPTNARVRPPRGCARARRTPRRQFCMPVEMKSRAMVSFSPFPRLRLLSWPSLACCTTTSPAVAVRVHHRTTAYQTLPTALPWTLLPPPPLSWANRVEIRPHCRLFPARVLPPHHRHHGPPWPAHLRHSLTSLTPVPTSSTRVDAHGKMLPPEIVCRNRNGSRVCRALATPAMATDGNPSRLASSHHLCPS
jgi:hypothetical protein